jgi:glycosyltransferase involved in cell wall biosynthesis
MRFTVIQTIPDLVGSITMEISLVTLVKGRHNALENLMEGIKRLSILPAELVIVHMNEPASLLTDMSIPITQIELHNEHLLPLAAARNYAIKQAKYDYVIFLDVDCIPSPSLLLDYQQAFEKSDILWAGKIRYLSKAAMADTSLMDLLEDLSDPDPVRAGNLNFSYELFWSLNFGCSKAVFERIGGFDELFKGYGAEDTDFSFSARHKNVPIGTVNTCAYHQYHPSYDPPLNHLQDIVLNANMFKRKWNKWPMEGWLRKFEDMGYLDWSEEHLTLIRQPTKLDIDGCLKSI